MQIAKIYPNGMIQHPLGRSCFMLALVLRTLIAPLRKMAGIVTGSFINLTIRHQIRPW
jgi:hypothetical protein